MKKAGRIIGYTFLILLSMFCLGRLSSCNDDKKYSDSQDESISSNINISNSILSMDNSSVSNSFVSSGSEDSSNNSSISISTSEGGSEELSSSPDVEFPNPEEPSKVTFKTSLSGVSTAVSYLMDYTAYGDVVCFTNDDGVHELFYDGFYELPNGKIRLYFSFDSQDITYETVDYNNTNDWYLVSTELNSLEFYYDQYSWSDYLLFTYSNIFFVINNDVEVCSYNLNEVNLNDDHYFVSKFYLKGVDYGITLGFTYDDDFDLDYYKENAFITLIQQGNFYILDLNCENISLVKFIKIDSFSTSLDEYPYGLYIDYLIINGIIHYLNDELIYESNVVLDDGSSLIIHLKGVD